MLETVEPQQLWIADRNMCTLGFLLGIAERQAAFVIRAHENLPWEAACDLQSAGLVESGELFEQEIWIEQEGHSFED